MCVVFSLNYGNMTSQVVIESDLRAAYRNHETTLLISSMKYYIIHTCMLVMKFRGYHQLYYYIIMFVRYIY